MTPFTRRSFLKTSAAAGLTAFTARSWAQVAGANSELRVAVVGLNGRGRSHLDRLGKIKGVRIAAFCDVDTAVLERARATTVDGKQPYAAVKTYVDIRELLASPDIDAVTLATPNHIHALHAIWACQAGKDVYVEKPLSHNVFEGRQVAAAAAKHNRIVQHGTQSRCNATLIRDMKLIHDGFIGKIVESRGYVYKNGNRGSIGHGTPGAAPAHLNWDLWQGPARATPFLAKTGKPAKAQPGLWVHYDWHYCWEYGNGEIGNQGVHEMDIACWGHNRGLPVSVFSAGGRVGLDDAGQTPNTQATTFGYADGSILTFEVRNLGSFEEADGGNCGNSFFGTKGMYVRGKGFFTYKETKGTPREAIPVPADAPKVEKADKWQRWIAAIRSRRPSDLPVSPLDAHRSCVHCHLGNLAFRAGRSLAFDPQTETFREPALNAQLTRAYRPGFAVPALA